jgi:hypothetical protein
LDFSCDHAKDGNCDSLMQFATAAARMEGAQPITTTAPGVKFGRREKKAHRQHG